MAANSPALVFAFRETREAVKTDAPPPALTWIYGRLRYPAGRSTVRATLLRLYYGRLHGVRCSPGDAPVVPDFRGTYGTRSEARSCCETPDDFIIALPFGSPPLGDDIVKSPTFCRPLHPLYRDRDVKDSRLYVEDLRARVCEELAGQLAGLSDEIRQLEKVGLT